MTKTKSDRMLLSEESILAKLIIQFLTDRKAVLEHSAFNSIDDATHYVYRLDTPLGGLSIAFSDPGHHFHCRFENVPLAVSKMGKETINPYTGKYNQYVFQRCTGQYAFDVVFMQHIRRIWPCCGMSL